MRGCARRRLELRPPAQTSAPSRGGCDNTVRTAAASRRPLFAASSGTSHSTPATAGVVSLSYCWIEHGGVGAGAGSLDEIGGSRAPSPALTKAWLMAHPTYLTGVSGNDNLPSNMQGYGMPNMSIMFDDDAEGPARPVRDVRQHRRDAHVHVGRRRSDQAAAHRDGMTDEPGELDEPAGQQSRSDGRGRRPDLSRQPLHARVHRRPAARPTRRTTTKRCSCRRARRATSRSRSPRRTSPAMACRLGRRDRPGFRARLQQLLAGAVVHADVDGETAPTSAPAPSSTRRSRSARSRATTTDVNLAASGNPTGSTAAVIRPTVTPPGTATLSMTSDATVMPGDYTVTVTGTSGAITKSVDFPLTYLTEAAAAPTLDSPANGANSTPLQPVFTWEPSAQASSYLFELATDAASRTS